MSEVQIIENENNLPVAGKYSLDDVKSFFYLMNAKPDTSIQLLKGKKKVTIAEIRDLNERIQRKLENHDLIGQIASINLIFEANAVNKVAFDCSVNLFDSVNLSLKLPKAVNTSFDIFNANIAMKTKYIRLIIFCLGVNFPPAISL